MTSARRFLIRGLLAGLLAGVFAFAVAYVVGEPSIDAAIAIEEAGADAHHGGTAEEHVHEDPAGTEVPRSLQSTAGLLTATAVAGTTLGGLVGVLSALALGRFGRLSPRASTLLVAGIGFVSVYAVPFAAYPPNPPAVGDPDTIGTRTALYFILVAISVVAAVTGVLVGRRLAARWGSWWAGLAAVGGYLMIMLVAIALLPGFHEVPADFPATVLYEFRTASFLTQLTLWAVLGVVLAELVHRLVRRAPGATHPDIELARLPG
jgi:predicted cobalt transporter CbtA